MVIGEVVIGAWWKRREEEKETKVV